MTAFDSYLYLLHILYSLFAAFTAMAAGTLALASCVGAFVSWRCTASDLRRIREERAACEACRDELRQAAEEWGADPVRERP